MVKGVKDVVTEEDLTLGSEHTMKYTDEILENYTLEIDIIVLTNAIPKNLINLKNIYFP